LELCQIALHCFALHVTMIHAWEESQGKITQGDTPRRPERDGEAARGQIRARRANEWN
jgi:hypothetical protein